MKLAVGFLLDLTVAAVCAAVALAQARPEQARERAGVVKYEMVTEGVHATEIFGTDALRDVRVEVRDFIVGPGKSAPAIPVIGLGVTELKAGEMETTIDGQTVRRRPGDFWVVRPGQKYSIRSLGGMVVLHVIVFIRK